MRSTPGPWFWILPLLLVGGVASAQFGSVGFGGSSGGGGGGGAFVALDGSNTSAGTLTSDLILTGGATGTDVTLSAGTVNGDMTLGCTTGACRHMTLGTSTGSFSFMDGADTILSINGDAATTDAIVFDVPSQTAANLFEVNEAGSSRLAIDHSGKVSMRTTTTTMLDVGTAGNRIFGVNSSNIETWSPLQNPSASCGGGVCIDDTEDFVCETNEGCNLGSSSLDWGTAFIATVDIENLHTHGAADTITLEDSSHLVPETDSSSNLGSSSLAFADVWTDELYGTSFVQTSEDQLGYASVPVVPACAAQTDVGKMFIHGDTDVASTSALCVCLNDSGVAFSWHKAAGAANCP